MNRWLLGAAIGLVLAGCSGGGESDDRNLLTTVGSNLSQAVTAKRSSGAVRTGPVVVTRKLLDETPGEVLEMVPDSLGTQDFLLRLDARRDHTPGLIETWKSSDDALVTTRDGVVINTRGLGGNLRSSDVAAIVSAFDGQGGGGERRMVIARKDGIAETVSFACDVTQLGREVIQIVDQRVSTHRMREDCIYRGVRITNEYWAETAGGRLRKSRQWISPEFGYAAITRLKN